MDEMTALAWSEDSPMTLGAIIDAVKCSMSIPVAEFVKSPANRSVCFDWCGRTPDGLDSYRGIYSDLAIGIGGPRAVKAADFLKECENCVGATFSGWKGGDYLMGRDTPVWVADPGESHRWGVCGVECDNWQIVLRTKYFGG